MSFDPAEDRFDVRMWKTRAEKAEAALAEANSREEQMAWAGAAILTYLENPKLRDTDWETVRTKLNWGLPTFDAARKVIAERDSLRAKLERYQSERNHYRDEKHALEATLAVQERVADSFSDEIHKLQDKLAAAEAMVVDKNNASKWHQQWADAVRREDAALARVKELEEELAKPVQTWQPTASFAALESAADRVAELEGALRECAEELDTSADFIHDYLVMCSPEGSEPFKTQQVRNRAAVERARTVLEKKP